MGSLNNPLVQCSKIGGFLKKINTIYGVFEKHDNELPKCEICHNNSSAFASLKKLLFLVVQEIMTPNPEENIIGENSKLESDLDIQHVLLEKVKAEMTEASSDEHSTFINNDDFNYSSEDDDQILNKADPLSKEKRKLPCRYCSRMFPEGRKLQQHLAHEHQIFNIEKIDPEVSSNLLECLLCTKRFSTKREIKYHMMSHRKALKQESQKKNSLRKKRIEETRKKTECEICKKTLRSEIGLKKHLKWHERMQKSASAVTDYQCNLCQRYYNNAINLERHKEFEKNANINCETCNQRFCLYTDLFNHQTTVHKIKSDRQCQYCQEKCSNFKLLYKHHREKHPKQKPPANPYLCEMCGLTMENPRDLGYHKMKCGLKVHKCPVCNKNFKTEADYEEHYRIHIPISQLQDLYSCEVCAKKFRTQLTLKKHKRLHTGEITERFCEICRRRFINAKSLDEHMLKHANEAPRPFKCEMCGKGFKIRKEFNFHMKTKHGLIALERTRLKKKPPQDPQPSASASSDNMLQL
ncbi:hypothetical protein DMENIID0001_007710 [Sergentomyia squamirostris]